MEKDTKKNQTLTYFSLFSGIGGFEQGIKQSKYKDKLICVGYSEIDKYADSIYRKQFPNRVERGTETHKPYGDVREIRTSDLPNFDLLVGGFPCQAFSHAGKRRGFDDTRGTLFFEIARILKDKKPKYFLLENVRNLLSHDKGNTFKTIIGVFSELGYTISWKICNSRNHGVPQNRERIFIVGYLGEGSGCKVLLKRRNNKKENDRRVNKGWLELEDGFSCTTTRAGDCFAVTTRFRCRPFNKKQDNYVLDKKGLRKLTPCECELLQGFPPGWTTLDAWGNEVSDMQRYKTIGNAVTTFVIRDIINEVFEDYEEH